MPRVEFTRHLAQLAPETFSVAGGSVREALGAVFAQLPALRSYVLDDQGEPRRHISLFSDGSPVRDRPGPSDALAADG